VAVKPAFDFSWHFLEEISWWSLGIATVASVVATFVTGGYAFAVGCMVGVLIDVAFIRAIATQARKEIETGSAASGRASMLFGVRLIAKAALLGLALLVPQVLGFAGTVVGVLVFDLTLAFVGSIIAASRLMSSPRSGGEPHA